jgi:spore germination protein PB
MNLVVHQQIVIHNLRVNTVTNSSVLQIGAAGVIKSLSNLYNTGGFAVPAPSLGPSPAAFVPLPSPVR